jgi:hypothetical protein
MKKTFYISIKNKKNKGFTLFVSLVVSSLILAVSISLSNIIFKQLIFANTGSESQLAFYAADSGAECALYWDRKGANGETLYDGSFATTTTSRAAQGPLDIMCGMGLQNYPALGPRVGSIYKEVDIINQNAATTTFYVNFSDTNINLTHRACAKVLVAKVIDLATGIERTRIDSRGYNAPFIGTRLGPQDVIDTSPTGDGHCDTTGARVVERAVRLDY